MTEYIAPNKEVFKFNPGSEFRSQDLFDNESDLQQSVRYENISPEIARRILASNYQNQRNISPRQVKRYADQMEKGLWRGANGEAIKISDEGHLIDGQHRLKAVIQSELTIRMMVIRGISHKYMVTLDGGKQRTHGDVLEVKTGGKIDNTSRIAGAIKLLLVAKRTIERFNQGLIREKHDVEKKGHLLLSTPEFILEYEKYSDIIEADKFITLNYVRSAIAEVAGGFAPTAFWYLYGGINREVAKKVLRVYAERMPTDGNKRCPIFVMRNKISALRNSTAVPKVMITGWEYLQFMAYAFECELNNKKMGNIAIGSVRELFTEQSSLDAVFKKLDK